MTTHALDLAPPTAVAHPPAAAPGVEPFRGDAARGGFDLVRLRSHDALAATFAPQVGMTCCSLRHEGVELIGERLGLEAYGRRSVCQSTRYPSGLRSASYVTGGVISVTSVARRLLARPSGG